MSRSYTTSPPKRLRACSGTALVFYLINFICDISGSHGGEYENDSFLGYSTVYSRGSRLTFQRCVLPSP
jgi:hypothetical protein